MDDPPSWTSEEARDRGTNVLLLMADQHSPRVLGCYGNDAIRTPHLDALAKRGTRFANAYSPSPICVPARASLATGRYVHATGNWDNAAPYLGHEAPSWGHRLQSQGHRVTTIGKLHYRASEDPTGFVDQRMPLHVQEGVGGVTGLLRGNAPASSQLRKLITDSGTGESDYIRYDRAVADEAVRWIATEATAVDKPWVLFVSFVCPHLPLVVPEEYAQMYPPEHLPFPIQGRPDEWPHHPALDLQRALKAHREPFDDMTIRRALQSYYGLVTFVDERIGLVLDALSDAGLDANTRIIYTSDHGDTLGDHGLWWKNSMYEGSVGIPMIMAGPGIPAGKVSRTPVSLIDVFPTVVEAVGASLEEGDADLPGTSLFEVAAQPDDKQRAVLSEYHAVFSGSAIFMLRLGDYKYIEYVGQAPQLFDLSSDRDELIDLALSSAHRSILAGCRQRLRALVEPEALDAHAKQDQHRRMIDLGGAQSVVQRAVSFMYSPTPAEFSEPKPEQ